MNTHVIDARLEQVERAIERIQSCNEDISRSLQSLVRLETQHLETRAALERAQGQMEKIDGRVKTIELRMPLLGRLEAGIIWLIVAIIGAVGGLIWTKVLAP